MSLKFKTGVVIFRHWAKQDGLHEIAEPFNTVEELLNLCMQPDPDYMVERVVIDGEDIGGASRTLTLVFQSSTLPDNASE